MIRIIGSQGSREHAAALELREHLLRAWPAASDDQGIDLRIVAGAKCHGQGVQDVDVLLLADCDPGVAFRPLLPFATRSGQIHQPDRVEVRSLCVAIEVKDHDPAGVRFVGTSVEVRYDGGWHSATEQVHRQVHAVKNYVEGARLPSPWVTGVVWLRNLPNTLLPPGTHNVVGQPLTWETLLTVVARLSPPRMVGGCWVMDASPRGDRLVLMKATDLFTRVIVPTRLDRRRVERIASDSTDLNGVAGSVGNRLTILRGRGGTGKTVRLLQLAHLLSERQAARVLVLTYNRALVADVRRLLTIMGIAPALAGQTVQIQTVHRFLAAALNALGFAIDGDADFAEAYERVKDEALAFLREGALDRDDLARLEGRDDTAFRWDYVFVDEAQDWPANERDLLFALFSPQRLVVADGVDQLVRTAMPTDWRVDLGADEVAVVPLRRCLRMKSGLARFASAVSRNLGLLYSEWIPNDEMGGGRVLIVDGPYLGDRAIHDRLVEANRSDGNRPVDMLVCVPPSQVAEDPSSGERRSLAAAVLERWGYRVWDGAAEDVREGYPTDADQVRIVQYESCRGLEGWVVVNLGLDRFFEHKRALATAIRGVDPALEAARWLTIPLSRAIDTLVIQLDAPSSPVADAIRAAASECADFVEYVMSR